jgi:hypothetical protein
VVGSCRIVADNNISIRDMTVLDGLDKWMRVAVHDEALIDEFLLKLSMENLSAYEPRRTRTSNRLIKSQLLYQLS